MNAVSILVGFAFGFVGSVPVSGPSAALVLHRALEGRIRSAFALASGAALVEGAYAYLAFRGLASASERYGWIERIAPIAAAAASLGVGLALAIGRQREPAPRALATALPDFGSRELGAFLLGAAITALNPVLLAGWAAAIAALYGLELLPFDRSAAGSFAIGVSAGVSSWFALFLALVKRLRLLLSRSALDRLMLGLGWMLILLGVALGLRAAHWLPSL
jgi:threonine/homoserine/homoserine lactone efflux protein